LGKTNGGAVSDISRSIAIDGSGNVYTIGYFYGTVDFDPGLGTFTLNSPGSYNIFISKLNASGNFVWAKQMGGASDALGQSIAIDGSGNVYTTGSFQGVSDFDPGPGTFTLTTVGGEDIFVSKLDALGNFVWAKQMGGAIGDRGISITTDGLGNAYTTGRFQGTSDFDPGPGTFTLSPAGSYDIFISKLDASGNFVWAKQMGGATLEEGYSITTDGSGNVYTTGYFQGVADFDPAPGTFTLSSVGSDDVFISKLDASGNFVWAKQMGGTTNDGSYSIALDSFGNIYTTGFFEGIVDFDPGLGTFTLNSIGGNADVFISKLDAMGNFVWAKQMEGTSFEYGHSIAIDGFGNIYSTGAFAGNTDFDPGPGTFTLSPTGGYDIFVHKISQCIAPYTPTNTTAMANQVLCVNNTTTLSATGTGTINWYATPTSTVILGAGSNYVTPNLSSGTYTYYAEALTCTVSASRTAITITVSVCTGLNYVSLNKIENEPIYPNPASSILTIKTENAIETISIYNSLGTLVLQAKEKTFSVEKLNPGIYFIQVKTEKGTTMNRFIKE